MRFVIHNRLATARNFRPLRVFWAVLASVGAFAALAASAAQAAEPPSIVTQKALTLDGARELIVAAQKVARAPHHGSRRRR